MWIPAEGGGGINHELQGGSLVLEPVIANLQHKQRVDASKAQGERYDDRCSYGNDGGGCKSEHHGRMTTGANM